MQAADTAQQCVIVVDMETGLDLLLDVLGSFPRDRALINRMNLQTDGQVARLEIQALRIDGTEAERLRLCLHKMAGVRRVKFGYRAVTIQR